MYTIKDIFLELRKTNSRIFVEKGSLKVSLGNDGIDDELKNVIKERKEDLINYIIRIGKAFVSIPLSEEMEDYPLSSAQQRLWVLSQFEEGNTAYNMPGVYVFEGVVDKVALVRAFEMLIERHEILRTVFRVDARGEVRQYIQSPTRSGFVLFEADLRGEPNAEGTVRK